MNFNILALKNVNILEILMKFNKVKYVLQFTIVFPCSLCWAWLQFYIKIGVSIETPYGEIILQLNDIRGDLRNLSKF